MCRTFSGLITKTGHFFDVQGDQHHTSLRSGARDMQEFRPKTIPVECIPVGESLKSDRAADWRGVLDQGLTNNELPDWCPREYVDPLLEEWRDYVVQELKTLNWRQKFQRIDLDSRTLTKLPSGLVVGGLRLAGCDSIRRLPSSLKFDTLDLVSSSHSDGRQHPPVNISWQQFDRRFPKKRRTKGVEIERLIEVCG